MKDRSAALKLMEAERRWLLENLRNAVASCACLGVEACARCGRARRMLVVLEERAKAKRLSGAKGA